MREFFQGARQHAAALGLLGRNPRLWKYVLWPVVINLIVGVLLYAWLLSTGLQLIDLAADTWPTALVWLARVLLIIAALLVIGFFIVRFGVVIGAPFYARLAEQIEILHGVAGNAAPPASAFVEIFRALRFEFSKLLIIIPIGLLLLLANFIPIAGQVIGTVGGILLGALIACLDFFDPALERRRLGFRQKIALVRQQMPASLGFGLLSVALVSIPLLNLLAVPICVAAGTRFLIERKVV